MTEMVDSVNLGVKLPEGTFAGGGYCDCKQFYSCLTFIDSSDAIVVSKPDSKCSQVTAAGLVTTTCCRGIQILIIIKPLLILNRMSNVFRITSISSFAFFVAPSTA